MQRLSHPVQQFLVKSVTLLLTLKASKMSSANEDILQELEMLVGEELQVAFCKSKLVERIRPVQT